jgi:fumarate reductase (CoM/CoB) subunit A
MGGSVQLMPDLSQIRVERTDVLIVGTGGAGLRAAIEAHDQGANVTLLAKGLARATHTRMSGGRYNVVTGIIPDDNTDIFFEDTITGGAFLNNQRLARILVDEALDRAYDLEAYGLAWERTTSSDYLVVASGGGTRLRTLGSFDEGIGVSEVMLHQIFRRKVRLREHHMIVDLIRDLENRVVGALVLDLARGTWIIYDCGAVVLATGGASQLYATNSGPSINTGDGIAVAYRAGAELVDIEFMQFIPIAFVYPPTARGYTLTEPQHYGMRHYDVHGEPGKLLNSLGERFILKHDPIRREGGTRDILARAIMLEILEGRGSPEGGVWLEPDPRIYESFLRERPIYVKRILENYGEEEARFLRPFQVMPSALYTTGGIRIDDMGSTTLAGLYAAGEVAGGVHGANRLGGSSMPDIQVFGRRAGLAAAQSALDRPDRPAPDTRLSRERADALGSILQRSGGMRPTVLKRQIQNLMWQNVGLVRNGPGLSDALRAFSELREQILPRLSVSSRTRILNREWMEAIELENLLDLGEAMALAALTRTETRGAHYRQDFPSIIDSAWLANLYVRRVRDRLTIEKRPVITLAETHQYKETRPEGSHHE